MAHTSQDYISAVNQVISVCKNAEGGFRGAADATRDVSFRTLFEQYSSQRAQFAEQLRAVVKETGNRPSDPSGVGDWGKPGAKLPQQEYLLSFPSLDTSGQTYSSDPR